MSMKVLVIEPQKTPYFKDIEHGLASLQREVKGCIEAVYPFDDDVCIICNEDGKLLKMDMNRALRDEDGDVCDIIVGTFLIVGLGEDEFIDLTPEQQYKYATMFETPEVFEFCNDRWEAFPATEFTDEYEKTIEQAFDDDEIEI